MKAEIKDGAIFIDNIKINEEIFDKEHSNYKLIEREDFVDELINWISESRRPTDKILMKEDLKYLIKLNDEYIFTSISTNEYVAKSDNEEEFNEICTELLDLNKEFENE